MHCHHSVSSYVFPETLDVKINIDYLSPCGGSDNDLVEHWEVNGAEEWPWWEVHTPHMTLQILINYWSAALYDNTYKQERTAHGKQTCYPVNTNISAE